MPTRTTWQVDPYMRCRFNEVSGAHYVSSFKVGEPITSAGIGRVVNVGPALEGQFAVGDLVVEGSMHFPWVEEATFDLTPRRNPTRAAGSGLMVHKIPPALCCITAPTGILGAVGQTGLTAFFGIERLAFRHGLTRGDVVVIYMYICICVYAYMYVHLFLHICT